MESDVAVNDQHRAVNVLAVGNSAGDPVAGDPVAENALVVNGSVALDVPRDYQQLVSRVYDAVQPPVSVRVYGHQVSIDGAERYELLIAAVPARPASGALTSALAQAAAQVVPAAQQVGASNGVSAALPVPPAPSAPKAPGRTGPGRYQVLINGGTHGDEPAGSQAVVRFLEERRYLRWPEVSFTVMPCTNPWGYVHDRREGPGGVDLNRSFLRARRTTAEVSLVKRALAGRRFDLFLDCHEDVDAPGLYCFAPQKLGRAIVAAAQRYGPVHSGDEVDGQIPLSGSVVMLDAEGALERRRDWKTWPLPFYVARYHQQRPPDAAAVAGAAEVAAQVAARAPDVGQVMTATIETPTNLPISQRVAMHLAAIDAALEMLTGHAPVHARREKQAVTLPL